MAKPIRSWDPAVFGLLVVCLLFGWVVKISVEGREVDFVDEETGIGLNYPKAWITMPPKDALLSVSDPQSLSTFKAKMTVRTYEWSADVGVNSFITDLTVERKESVSLYRILSMNPFQLRNVEATKLEYAYAVDPLKLSVAAISIPIVVRAFDVIVSKNNKMYVFTFEAEEKEYKDNIKRFHAIAQSIHLQ